MCQTLWILFLALYHDVITWILFLALYHDVMHYIVQTVNNSCLMLPIKSRHYIYLHQKLHQACTGWLAWDALPTLSVMHHTYLACPKTRECTRWNPGWGGLLAAAARWPDLQTEGRNSCLEASCPTSGRSYPEEECLKERNRNDKWKDALKESNRDIENKKIQSRGEEQLV